jgi:glycosyltransferase involved in cell wall biosynthesis
MQKQISAAIITLNEECNIREVIANVQQVCDEVLVIDSFSTDKTVEIAESMGAKVVQQKYLGDGGQKAFCEPLSTNDWVLSIDADERLTDEAVECIRNLDLASTPFDGFSFKRRSFIGKKYIRQWYPDRVVRLYDRSKCGYNTEGEHGSVQTKNYKELDVDMLHYSFDSFGTLVKKADRFAVNLALVRYKEGKRASWYDPFLHGFGAFFKGMIVKRGILGGLQEWHVAFASAYNSYMKYVIMLELQEKEKDEA